MSSPAGSTPAAPLATRHERDDAPEPKGPAAFLAEFVGTLFLVLAICGFLSATSPRGFNLADLGLLHALALLTIVYTIGSISGAHVNPALTVGLATIRKISPRDAGVYVVMQVAGGLAGALLAKAFFLGRGSLVDYGAATVSNRYLQGGSVGLAFLAELIGTFALMWAVMGTAVNPNAPKGVAGLAIGGTLGFAVMVFGPATGGSFNPARWLAPAIASGNFSDAWLYIIAPLVGAVGAALIYSAMLTRGERRFEPQPARVGESAERPYEAATQPARVGESAQRPAAGTPPARDVEPPAR